ncbi:exonuclease subunit SbcC [Salmonella enterica]|nr:exonuclease subunit SbcC [Salmonella enterica]
MRILHTSDWHLGQNFYSKSRAAEHQAFLDWLLETAQAHQVDAIIVAGDIFDTGSPPSYARELYNRFVVNLQQTGCHLVVLAGNHDSVATLNESRDILAFLNTTVIASAGYAPRLLHRRDGSPGAVLCPIPFLRPRDILTSQAGLSGSEKQQQLLHAIADYYQQQYREACLLRGERKLPVIATGHLTTVGASKSDAVRDIYIGTLDAFPAQHFPPADYIALGHIHRAQCVGGTEHIRYCGSPIALSFDECGKSKCVHLVTFDQGKWQSTESLAVPVTQPLAVLKGDLASITEQLEQWRGVEQSPPVWLTRKNELHTELHARQQALYAAQEAREKAQPQLAALTLAQPARQLRPHWERIQEQTRAVERVRQHSDEVNARLQSAYRLRQRIRACAHRQFTQLNATGQRLKTWLAEHDGIRVWRSELAGWRALLTQQSHDRAQLSQWQQQLLSDTRQRDALPPLTLDLTPQALAEARALHTRQRPLRHRLAALQGQILPKQKRQAQLQAAIARHHQEQAQYTQRLADKRLSYKTKAQELADVRTICEQEARIKDLESQRAHLQSGQPCPLCGSTTHPAIAAYQALELSANQTRRDALEKEVKTLAEEGAALRGQLDALTQQLQRDESEAQSLLQEEQALTEEWQTLCATLGVQLQPQEDLAGWLTAAEEHEQQLDQLSQRHALQTQIAAHTEQVARFTAQIAQRQASLTADLAQYTLSLPAPEDEASWLNERADEAKIWQQRQTEFADLQTQIDRLAPLLETLPQTDTADSDDDVPLDNWRQAHDECVSLQSQLQTLQEQTTQEQQRAAEAIAHFDAALKNSPFDSQATFLAALLDEETVTRLEKQQQTLESQLQQAKALSAQSAQALADHQQQPPAGLDPTCTAEQLAQRLTQLAQQLRENTTRQGEIRQQIKQDADNRQRQRALMAEMKQASQQVEDWGYLNALIGSKEGDKFRKFAQGLTLDNLVWLANHQLTRLHGRYLLQRKASDALELEVVDTWQADAVRDTRTLSGGESFLVSLALALALSDLVSHKTRIDSLFLDEGFGTLDSETLDAALDALDALNASGKTIGVISHVEAMKERIPVQIKVKKINGLGYSKLDKAFAVE